MVVLMGLSGPGNGCTAADKLFNNFSYSPSGGGAPPAIDVEAHLDLNPATLTAGWSFTSATGAFDGNFDLGFSVAVIPAVCPFCTIVSAIEQILAPTVGPLQTQAVLVALTPGGSNNPVKLDTQNFGDLSNGSNYAPGVLAVVKAASTSGIDGTHPLISFESSVNQSAIPEPVTLSLMGMGLLGLSFIRWRRAQN
jgi:hypothetical protein